MRQIILFLSSAFMIVFISGCENKKTTVKEQHAGDTTSKRFLQDGDFEVSYKDTDKITNNFLLAELKPVRDNFFAINSTENWTRTKTVELEETTEGGDAIFYFSGDSLKKIIVKLYGETFQQLNEYYLLNDKISFVIERNIEYNRPLYFDSIAMLETGDNETFDLKRSRYKEIRNYFIDGRLVHQVTDSGARTEFAKEYLLHEEKRLLDEFKLVLAFSMN